MSEPKNGGSGERPPASPVASQVVLKIPGKESLRPPLPKRFYKSVTVAPCEEGFAVLLDGRSIRTPKRQALVLPSRALADAVAAEWTAQAERIDPDTMPLTRLANTAIDAVAARMSEVAANIAAFAGSDLLCYRVAGPEGLVARQSAEWDPVLDWARDVLGAEFSLASGVVHVAQPQEALARILSAVEPLDPFRLAALHVITTLTGSALIALAHMSGRLDLEDAWTAAHVDEDWQIEQWGRDAEADERRMQRFAEFEAASRLMSLLG
jgi:chaperone required for assembly of F1-ATPase